MSLERGAIVSCSARCCLRAGDCRGRRAVLRPPTMLFRVSLSDSRQSLDSSALPGGARERGNSPVRGRRRPGTAVLPAKWRYNATLRPVARILEKGIRNKIHQPSRPTPAGLISRPEGSVSRTLSCSASIECSGRSSSSTSNSFQPTRGKSSEAYSTTLGSES